MPVHILITVATGKENELKIKGIMEKYIKLMRGKLAFEKKVDLQRGYATN